MNIKKRILPMMLAVLMIFSVISALSLTTVSAAEKLIDFSAGKSVRANVENHTSHHMVNEATPNSWKTSVENGRAIVDLGEICNISKFTILPGNNWAVSCVVYGSNDITVWDENSENCDYIVGSESKWEQITNFSDWINQYADGSGWWVLNGAAGPNIFEEFTTPITYRYIMIEANVWGPIQHFGIYGYDTLTSIDVSGTFKTDYIEGENFAKSGMVVKATYMSGDVITLSAADYSIVPSVISLDTEKVSVVYGSFMQEVAITSVTPKAATGIRAEQKEDVDIYTGDTLSEDNITVYATFTNGKEEEITEYEVDPDIFEEDGETEVTITAMGFDTKITVDVLKLEIEDIEITELPRTEYVAGMTFNPEGMVVSIIYNSGRKKATDDYDYDLKDELTEEDTLLTVTLKDTDFTATIELTYVEDAVAELEITELPEANLSYFAGQSFNLQGATIKAIYISGEIVDLDWDDEEITFDPEVLTVDTEEVTVTYKDASVTITGITVEEKVLKEIKVKELPALVEYTVGDSLDVTGMVVVAIYEDSDEEFAITNYVVTPATFETAGEEVEVTITFGEKSDTFVVKVSVAAEEKLKGDVNGDGSVTITDAIAIFRHLADKVKITDADVEWAADVDGNGKIEILDAINIFRYLADKMTLDELQALYLNNVEVTVPGEDDEEEEETPVETIPEEIV